MEPRELYNAIRGRSEYDEQMNRERWEQVRIIAFHSIVSHLGKKSKIKSPTDLIPFPWDKNSIAKVYSEEEKRELIRQSNKALGKK